MPLRVEKSLSDVFFFLLYRFPPTAGGGGGGLQEASGLLFAPLGKKKIKSTHEHSHCVGFKPSSQHLSGFVCIFTIVHFPKFLSKRHVRFGAIYWLMLFFQFL